MPTNQTILSVPGMTCGHCQAAVTTELAKVPGVRSVRVDLATKLVTVEAEAGVELDRDAMVAAVDEAGFEVAEPAS